MAEAFKQFSFSLHRGCYKYKMKCACLAVAAPVSTTLHSLREQPVCLPAATHRSATAPYFSVKHSSTSPPPSLSVCALPYRSAVPLPISRPFFLPPGLRTLTRHIFLFIFIGIVV